MHVNNFNHKCYLLSIKIKHNSAMFVNISNLIYILSKYVLKYIYGRILLVIYLINFIYVRSYTLIFKFVRHTIIKYQWWFKKIG